MAVLSWITVELCLIFPGFILRSPRVDLITLNHNNWFCQWGIQTVWWNKFVGFHFFCDGFSNDHVFGLRYFIQRIWAVSLLLVSIYPVLEFDVRNYGEFLSEDHSMYIYRLWMLDYSSQLEVCGCNMSCVYRLVKTLVSKWFLVPSVRAIVLWLF